MQTSDSVGRPCATSATDGVYSHGGAGRFLLAPHQLRRWRGALSFGSRERKQSEKRWKVQSAFFYYRFHFVCCWKRKRRNRSAAAAAKAQRRTNATVYANYHFALLLFSLLLLSNLRLFDAANVGVREREQRAFRQRDQSHPTSSILTLELYRRSSSILPVLLSSAPQMPSNPRQKPLLYMK